MESTMVEYLLDQREPFTEAPLCDVDSLVFSTIAYFNLENGAVGRSVPTDRLALPVAICGITHADLYGRIWLERMGGEKFLAALLTSPRFMDVQVAYYVNEVSSHFEKQFSAMTFFLPNGEAYVAYRGTDNTLAGWKEDFNLTFMEKLPSQLSARTYLEDIADTGVERLFVGGHSKGGNLAEYAALTCRDKTFDRIAHVFNHDGPGFAFAPSERISQGLYADKLRKTVPGSSIFGMLMENRSNHRVVRSSGALFAQHASTMWVVENGDFVSLDAVSPEAAIISGTLNSWSELYGRKEREMFIDAVYEVFCAANADTWAEFSKDRPANMLAVAEATAKLPADMRTKMFAMLRDIAPIVRSEAVKQALANLPGQISQTNSTT